MPGSHRDYSICHSLIMAVITVLLIHSPTVELRCYNRDLCLASPESGIVVGVIDTNGTKCTELANNSLVILDENDVITSQCGIRCTGRQWLEDSQVLEWLIPPLSRLNATSPGGMQSIYCNDSNCRYLDLIRSQAFSVNTDEGIYTCSVRHGSHTLHIGLYRTYPDAPKIVNLTVNLDETANLMLLSCTSSKSPPTSVNWLQDDMNINEFEGKSVVKEQRIRDRRLSTYENILKIPFQNLSTGKYTCIVNNTLGEAVSDVDIVVALKSPVIDNINTTNITWSLLKFNNYSSPSGAHIVYLPEANYRYTVELNGGNCSGAEIQHVNVTSNHYRLPDPKCHHTSERDTIILHGGANYTVRVRAWSIINIDSIASNFSQTKSFTTEARAPCGVPQNFTVQRQGLLSVMLSWSTVLCHEQNGKILRYHLYRRRDGSITTRVVNASSREMSFETFSNSCPFLTYEYGIAAENAADRGPNAIENARILTEVEIGVVFAATTMIILCLIVSCLCYCRLKRSRRKGLSHRRMSSGSMHENSGSRSQADLNQIEMENVADSLPEEPLLPPEPVIEVFPDNMLACPGEYVIMYVSVYGNPTPKITWYHGNESVLSDGTIEIGEDGTLSIPSMEARHVGNYKLVATNEHGFCEAEMELHMESEDSPRLHRALSMSLMIDSAPVPISSLEEYIASHHARCNEPFQHEFLSLISENSGETRIGELPENRALNRFKHIVPYDNNRVVLKPIPGSDVCQHDYINASFVDGHILPKKFIATQGPLPHTVIDFWRLVWQENIPMIVMLCKTVEGHRVRCQQYWPTSGSQNYGPFSVKLESEQRQADYVLRTFKIKMSSTLDTPKYIEHYQFTSWPDQLLPENSSPVLTLHKKALANASWEGPILVHCSSGIGRTGSFIALDRALQQAEEGVVDVMGIVNDMRQQRMKMVQTLAQYIDIYDSVLENIVCGETKIDADASLRMALKKLRTVDQITGQTELEKQFRVLQEITPSPLEVTGAARSRDTIFHSMEFLPRDNRRTVRFGGTSDCIHATFVDGYKHKNAFMITQGPQEGSCNEFWKMIYQYNCGTLVMLSQLVEYNQQVCYRYWPKAGSEVYGDYSVEFMSESRQENLITTEFQVTCTANESKNDRPHPLTHFQVLNWTPDGQCSNLDTITTLLSEVTINQIKTGNHPIVVHCSDTVGRSAIFCAALSVIEQCKAEVAIDVFHIVKSTKMQKPGSVVSVEQYGLIFDIVLSYLDTMENYANFQS